MPGLNKTEPSDAGVTMNPTKPSVDMKEDIDYSLYLGTITAIGSIFNSLRYYVVNLRYSPLQYVRLACSLQARCRDLENNNRRCLVAAPPSPISRSSRYESRAEPAAGKKRRMINVNKSAVKKRRKKLKLQMFKCEHLAKLLLLESYASTDCGRAGGKEVSLEEGLGIGRLILKMLQCNEHMAVEELGRRTVDFMKVCIVEIQNRYIKNGMKL